jgi:hypothetical protein
MGWMNIRVLVGAQHVTPCSKSRIEVKYIWKNTRLTAKYMSIGLPQEN